MKIDKNVPLLNAGKRHGNSKLTFFDKLQVGDSVLFKFDDNITVNKIATRANYWKMRNPKKNLTLRTVEDGIRVWRIK